MKVLCDIMATISIAKNPIHHDRTKYAIGHHFIKEKLESNTTDLIYITTHQGTSRVKSEELTPKLGIFDIFPPA